MKRIISIFCLCLLSALSAGPGAAQTPTPDDPQFDGAALLDLLASPAPDTADDPERADRLLDYARRLYEARIQGLDKLRAALPNEADRQFVEDWLFFERCRLVATFLNSRNDDGPPADEAGEKQHGLFAALRASLARARDRGKLRAMQDFTARLLQEKVDFLLECLKKARTWTPCSCARRNPSPAWATPAAIPRSCSS